MDLAQKIRQARLDAGLSQRQLCGDRITRNMLSQIEHGSAHPSMETLKYLAGQLGKPVSFFLEEEAVTSPNLALMAKVRDAEPSEVLSLLGQYQAPDPVFDAERWLLEALTCLKLAETALAQEKPDYARSLLERAAVTGSRTSYYTEDLERRRLLLSCRAGISPAELEPQLPDNSQELMVRAQAAFTRGDYAGCAANLLACTTRTPHWYLLRGQGLMAQKEYSAAIDNLKQCEDTLPRQSRSCLEVCCRELGDFEKAYHYACLTRDAE